MKIEGNSMRDRRTAGANAHHNDFANNWDDPAITYRDADSRETT